MPTLLALKQGVLRKLAWTDDKVGLLPIPLTSTSTAADALGIRDTKLARGTHSAGNYNGRHVEIVETVTGSPTIGSVAAVDDGGFDLTDLITVSPAFDDEVQSGTDYLMYPRKLVPETLVDAINDVLTKIEAPYLWAPSLVADSDMDADDLTKWPAVAGPPTTREFVVTAANILLGQRALKLVTVAAATDGARTSTFSTHEYENLLVCLPVSVTTGDMRVVLYDASNSAAIKTVTEINDDAWTQVRFTEMVPANCEQAYIQFLADTTAVSTFYVSPHVIVQGSRRRTYDAPSWLVSESQVIEALYLPSGQSAEATDAYVALSAQMKAAMGLDFLRSDRDVTPMRVTFAGGSYPIYLLCKRPFAELSALTDTTACDEEYVVAKASAQILKDRGDDGWWVLDREAEKRALKMGYGGRQLGGEAPTVLV